jgi:bifunctional non-homologous end joining protein LigD
MFGSFDFCLPTRGIKVPDRPEWIQEVKYDGYRLRAERDGERVRLITRGGYDWTKRYPWIVEAALKNRIRQFVIDGEAVILGVDGISDFNALHAGKSNRDVQLYAFDVLAMDGDDLRALPLSMRKASLAKLLHLRPDGIFTGSFEQGEIGPPSRCLSGSQTYPASETGLPRLPTDLPDETKCGTGVLFAVTDCLISSFRPPRH